MKTDRPVWADYRATCRPFDTGCRQCGRTITRGRAYCSGVCSDVFQKNHFWNRARWEAMLRSCVSDDARQRGIESAAICARCKEPARAIRRAEVIERGRTFPASYWAPEINHKVPLNGVRPDFGCCHHQENLECVCHPCHVTIGIEQRAAGLIGKPKLQLPMEFSA